MPPPPPQAFGLGAADPPPLHLHAAPPHRLTSPPPSQCTQCNCKNSKCLKLYCECFSSGHYCDPDTCNCKNCENTIEVWPALVPIFACLSVAAALAATATASLAPPCRSFHRGASTSALTLLPVTMPAVALQFEKERKKAVKHTLSRNKDAFRPKIGTKVWPCGSVCSSTPAGLRS